MPCFSDETMSYLQESRWHSQACNKDMWKRLPKLMPAGSDHDGSHAAAACICGITEVRRLAKRMALRLQGSIEAGARSWMFEDGSLAISVFDLEIELKAMRDLLVVYEVKHAGWWKSS